MARPLRIEYEDAYYHITVRGNEKRSIFKSDRDREKFLGYLESATDRYCAVIHAYCLMNNHYHLLVQTPLANLSKIMQHINGAYTTYYNVKRNRSGHLLQGRYKAIVVDADAYAQELSRYIHLNPVRAGIADKPDQYPWSSYVSYIHAEKQPEWLCTEFILGLFNRNTAKARNQYHRFVESIIGKQIENPLRNVFASTILGGEVFINNIAAQHLEIKAVDRGLPDTKHFHKKPGIKEIIEYVGKNLPDNSGLSKRIGLYICHRYSGQRLNDIGVHFGISESGVSQASRRLSKQIEKDMALQKRVARILSELGLSRV